MKAHQETEKEVLLTISGEGENERRAWLPKPAWIRNFWDTQPSHTREGKLRVRFGVGPGKSMNFPECPKPEADEPEKGNWSFSTNRTGQIVACLVLESVRDTLGEAGGFWVTRVQIFLRA